jgi:hypothetical protein
MIQTKKKFYQNNNFKTALWKEVSKNCSDDFWCYTTFERRVFYALFGLTVVMGFLYFSGITNEIVQVYRMSSQFNYLHEEQMNLRSSVDIYPTLASENTNGN